MPIRYVVRPSHIRRTPQLIAEGLNATTRRYPGRGPYDPRRDFFLVYPRPGCLDSGAISEPARLLSSRRVAQERGSGSTSLSYEELYEFFSSDKARQRISLAAAGVSTPYTARSSSVRTNNTVPVGSFITRPLRHSRGQGYRITPDPNDFIPGQEYIQQLYPKDREYRVIYCYGDPIIVLRKKVAEDTPQEAPWNHAAGARFQTINDVPNCRLCHTEFFETMDRLPIIKSAHLVAVDVMYSNTLGYSVCEFNTCPGITIEANLRKVVSHVADHCRQ